ncbi:MAG: hypothetical protein OEN23_07670 [Paracoccaceae bacterium]|nr:hypothetical protein [Paracoccaceae bacterium]
MRNDFSREALLEFLDYLSEKGLANKNTIVGRKAAANNVLSILNEQEAADLRSIDLTDVEVRFQNLMGSKYTPKSLQVYRSRVGKAVRDFLRYKENPANFRVRSSQGTRKARGKAPNDQGNDAAERNRVDHDVGGVARADTVNIPVPLRPSCIVQLNGVPVDLTPHEARKIANVAIAMAQGETE